MVATVRIIDANTGKEVKVGDTFTNVNGIHQLLHVDENLFTATAAFLRQVHPRAEPELVYVPLQVRYTHPSFFGRKVGFIPS